MSFDALIHLLHKSYTFACGIFFFNQEKQAFFRIDRHYMLQTYVTQYGHDNLYFKGLNAPQAAANVLTRICHNISIKEGNKIEKSETKKQTKKVESDHIRFNSFT